MDRKDPNFFWQSIRHLLNHDNKNSDSNIGTDQWLDYFSKLLSAGKNCKSQFSSYIDSSLGLIEHCSDSVDNNILNTDIDSNEILKSIKQLKSSKSSGIDLITNDMLKSSFPILIEPINKLFNNILHYGIFSNDWNCSLITPILKSGSASDPANNRGIAVAYSLSKLFHKNNY